MGFGRLAALVGRRMVGFRSGDAFAVDLSDLDSDLSMVVNMNALMARQLRSNGVGVDDVMEPVMALANLALDAARSEEELENSRRFMHAYADAVWADAFRRRAEREGIC